VAVVDDVHRELDDPVADGDVRLRRFRVLERVRERLLHDPVGREVEPGRQRRSHALDRQLDRQSGVANLLEQLGELLEPRLRRERRVRVLLGPDHPEQAAELAQRLAARRLDRRQRRPRPRRLRVKDVGARRRLNDHHAHVVRDHIVQLTRDPGLLARHRAARLLLPLALEADRLGLELSEIRAARAQVVTDDPRPRRQAEREQRRVDLDVRRDQDRQRQRDADDQRGAR
jgi:hypothetical protein